MPTRVDWHLVQAPNSLLAQSRRDLSGFEHADGWGIAAYDGGEVRVQRRASAAHDGHYFREATARVEATTGACPRAPGHGGPHRARQHPSFRARTILPGPQRHGALLRRDPAAPARGYDGGAPRRDPREHRQRASPAPDPR